MRAVYYERHGSADVLQLGELPTPEPEPHQVLVEVVATSVNPIDRRLRNGELQAYITRTFPVIPGWDLAGRIVALGEAVSGWQIGDEVAGLAFTWSAQHGTYAEFVPVDAGAIATKPDALSFTEAAALPLVSLTAWQALTEFGGLRAGQSVLIQAGAGGVGSVAIPMAKHLGARVYTTASAASASYVRALGADHVIDYRKVDYAKALLDEEPEGVDLVLELLLGEGIAETAVELCRTGGCVAYMNNEPPDLPALTQRNIKAEFIHHRPDGAMLAKLLTAFAEGVFALPHIQVWPLEKAREAHQLSEAGHTRGKVVLEISPGVHA